MGKQAWIVVAASTLLITTLSAASSQVTNAGVTLAIVEPTRESLLVGDVAFKAQLSPDSASVTTVEVFLDGSPKPVCTIPRRPFECTFKLPEQISKRSIRAVANLADGNRVSASVLTSGGIEIGVETNAVLVPIVVTDYLGRFVKGLKRESFTVFEDGVSQPITFVDPENVPLDIVVAVDTSGSMMPSLGKLKSAVKRFLTSVEALKRTNAHVRLTVLAFNDRTFIVSSPDAEPSERIEAVERLMAFGGTAIYDAVFRSLDLFGTEVSRKAVVLFTDGDDRSSLASPEPVLRRIRENDATVHVITQGPQSQMASVRKTVAAFAEVSGGKAFAVEKIDQLDEVLEFIISDLTNQYLVGYSPSNTARDGTLRKITVKTPVGSHRIRAREGYRAPAK